MSADNRANLERSEGFQEHTQDATAAIADHVVDFGHGDVSISQAVFANLSTLISGDAKFVALTVVSNTQLGLLLTLTPTHARAMAESLVRMAAAMEAEAFTAATDALRKAAKK